LSRWRKRKIDLELTSRKLAATEKTIVDLAIRRARLETEIELYVLRQRKRGVA
jgi:hypothetical protein